MSTKDQNAALRQGFVTVEILERDTRIPKSIEEFHQMRDNSPYATVSYDELPPVGDVGQVGVRRSSGGVVGLGGGGVVGLGGGGVLGLGGGGAGGGIASVVVAPDHGPGGGLGGVSSARSGASGGGVVEEAQFNEYPDSDEGQRAVVDVGFRGGSGGGNNSASSEEEEEESGQESEGEMAGGTDGGGKSPASFSPPAKRRRRPPPRYE